MRDTLEAMMDRLDSHQEKVYEHLLDLQNDGRLRQYAGLADCPFDLVTYTQTYKRTLYFTKDGFKYCQGNGAFREFSVEDKYLKDQQGRYLLELFPNLSIKVVYSRLEIHLKEFPMYKAMKQDGGNYERRLGKSA